MPKNAHKWLKIGNFWNFFFFQNWKTQLSKNIWIYVIAFAPIVIQTQQAPQNDHRNLSFVKGTIVVGNRMTRKGPNMTISTGCLFNFRTDFRWDTSGECLWQLLITQCCNKFRFVHKTLEFQLLFISMNLQRGNALCIMGTVGHHRKLDEIYNLGTISTQEE